jgi:DNA polymerase-3 subunit delta'
VSEEKSADIEPKAPRSTTALYGHREAECVLLDVYRSGRFPHAWLLSGPPGIGKATLAYRSARFLLANPNHHENAVQSACSLAVNDNHPAVRRIAAQAEGNLLVLERTINEKTGKLRQDIAVEDVRRTVSFFGSTAATAGWRIAIVDSVDELNPQGTNALLKILEEPPRRSVLLLVSHSPGRVLPTIRSRCRVISLRPLSSEDVARAAAEAVEEPSDAAEIVAAAQAAEGSVRRALALLGADTLDLRSRTITLLDRLPALDHRALHVLGDRLFGTEPAVLAAFIDTVNGWLSARLTETQQPLARLDRWAAIWEQFNAAARDAADYNLERKPLVFNVFAWLADASHR